VQGLSSFLLLRRDTSVYATTVGSVDEEDDGEESFANEQLRKAVRRSQASMPLNPLPNSAAAAALAYAAEQVGPCCKVRRTVFMEA
jgi:hypothetical protein